MSNIVSRIQAAIDAMRGAPSISATVIDGLVTALEEIKGPSALVLPAGGVDPAVIAHTMRVMGEGRPLLLAVDAGCSASLLSAPTGIEEVDKDWREMWAEIITPDGMIDVVQLKKELSDFSTLIHSTTQIMEHATGGQCTKPMTMASTVIALIDDHVTKQVEEAVAEAREDDSE